ncbi:MAG: BolA family transcriptional regulator [Myxococcales bacterium]|nr:BolA family transcriptional regulator [Myxococcales bacterium]
MIEPEAVRSLLLQAFPDGDVAVLDMTGTKDHYDARVVSGAFVGRSRIEQHRMVYAALGDAMQGAVHALALKTYTPEAWAKLKG